MAATLESVILKVQQEAFPRRIRVVDFFRDFDKLHKYEITPNQFIRCMQMLFDRRVKLTGSDVQVLIDTYMVPNGNVDYKSFCDEVEKVFTTKNLHLQPTVEAPEAGSQVAVPFSCYTTDDPHLNAVLHRCALLLKARGMVMRYAYEDADRGDSASLIVPRRGGKVTETQFIRFFPFQKEFTMEEIKMIIAAYKESDGNVNYRRFNDDITSIDEVPKDAPIPTSDFIPPPDDGAVWSSTDYSVLERVTAKIIESRIRIKDYFRDFDPLGKGKCQWAHMDTVFGICGLAKFSEEERMVLKEQYGSKDIHLNMFDYAAFCKDVNRAFTYAEVHTDPLAQVDMPGADSTMPYRVSRILLTNEEKKKLLQIEKDVRARVNKRRILFINNFKDFDRTGTGHVTINQFFRVMQTLNLTQGPAEIALLRKRYCDQGNRDYFNYREFCRVCDPPSGDLFLAELQQLAPYEKHVPTKYFDEIGQVWQQKEHIELEATRKEEQLAELKRLSIERVGVEMAD